VALDTALVVWGTQLDRLGVALVSEEGDFLELSEQRRLARMTCIAGIVYMAPEKALEPNRRYTLETWDGSYLSARRTSATFTTGTSLRDTRAPMVDLHLFRVSGPDRFLETFVETDTDEPLFLQVRGQHGVSSFNFDPQVNGDVPPEVHFGDVECGELEVVDVAGRTLSTQTLCNPQKCATVPTGVSGGCRLNHGTPTSRGLPGWLLVLAACVSRRRRSPV
jgi:hypothetical protein